MRAQVFIDQTTGGFVEVSVVKHGLSSRAGHKYDAVGKAYQSVETPRKRPIFVDKLVTSFFVPAPKVKIFQTLGSWQDWLWSAL